MDSDPLGPAARQWLSRSPAGDDRDAELARLRERLAFYQSFEGLIQDNITRSGELLRQAMDMREAASAELAAAQANVARQRSEDRARFRILFSAMLDELTVLQGQAERLARRLTNALDEIELDLPPGATTSSLTEIDLRDDDTLRRALALDAGPLDLFADATSALDLDLTSESAEAPTAPTEADPLQRTGIDLATESDTHSEVDHAAPPSPPYVLETHSADSTDLGQPIDDFDDIPLDVQPFALEHAPAPRRFAAENDLALQPALDRGSIPVETSTERNDTADAGTAAGTKSTIVLVHGVPRATTALSLKRYLEGLSHVGAVEPREFAEGILRLEVSGTRPLAFDDLRSWSEGPSLEPVHLRDDLVEVRLSH